MTNTSHHWITLKSIGFVGAAILLVLVLVASAPTRRTHWASSGVGVGRMSDSTHFTVRGNVSGRLAPGVMVPLDVEIVNPHNVPMVVGRVTVTLRLVRAPHADRSHPCTVGDFRVRQASTALEVLVPARSTRQLSRLGVPALLRPGVVMVNRPVNQDGCKESSVALTYTAAGRLIT